MFLLISHHVTWITYWFWWMRSMADEGCMTTYPYWLKGKRHREQWNEWGRSIHRYRSTIKTQERSTFLNFLSDVLLRMQHCLSDCLLHKLFQSWSNQITPKTRLIYASEVWTLSQITCKWREKQHCFFKYQSQLFLLNENCWIMN